MSDQAFDDLAADDTDRMAARAMTAAASAHALPAGEAAPNFRLPDRDGHPVGLLDLIADGPAAIHFHRGTWCDFCHDNLKDLAAAYGAIRAAGGDLVAVAPNVEADGPLGRPPFRTLTDQGLRVASAYGVAFTLPADLRPAYRARGYVPPRTGEWLVPIPSTFLIDRGGLIGLAAIDIDYRKRLRPSLILSALQALQRRG